MTISSVNNVNRNYGPQNPGDPQPHLNGGGPQKPGDPQPHLNCGGKVGPNGETGNQCGPRGEAPGSGETSSSSNNISEILQQLMELISSGGSGGPQKEGDPNPLENMFTALA